MRFELKKVFSKRSNQVAILLVLLFILYSAWRETTYMVWVNEDDTELKGKAAAEKLQDEAARWYGPLLPEKLAEVISQGTEQSNREIYTLLAMSFGGFHKLNSTVLDIKPEDASYFYDNRIKNLREWLQTLGNWYTDGEKEFLITRFKEMETPLDYKYTRGWKNVTEGTQNLQMFLLLAIGFLVSGIFSEEYRTGASAVFFSTASGRDRAIGAKIKAGLLIITAAYWLSFGLYSILVFMELGTGGADCMIQISIIGWESFYNITFLQHYLLIAVGGYIGCLFGGSLAMLISAKLKSAVLSITVQFAVIFIPALLKLTATTPIIEKMIGILPYQLLRIYALVGDFYIYHIAGKYVGSIGILITIYFVLSIASQSYTYIVFRKVK